MGGVVRVKYSPDPHLSCILLFPFFTSRSYTQLLHFSHDWFSYHVGPLSWPRSDLKAIKHKTFCKTRMPPSSPCAAFLRNYDNNSVAAGVAGSLMWGWGQWDWEFTKVLRAGSGQGGLLGLCTPFALCHKLFLSCRKPAAARYTAAPTLSCIHW